MPRETLEEQVENNTGFWRWVAWFALGLKVLWLLFVIAIFIAIGVAIFLGLSGNG